MMEYMPPYTNEQLQMVKDEQIAQLDKAAREEKAALERRGQGGKLALIGLRDDGGANFGQGRSDRSWGTWAQIFTRRWGRGLAQLYTRGGRVNYFTSTYFY